MCNFKDVELYVHMIVGDEYTLPKKMNGYKI